LCWVSAGPATPPARLEHQFERRRHPPPYLTAIGRRAAMETIRRKSAAFLPSLTLPSRLRRQKTAFVSYLMRGATIFGYSDSPLIMPRRGIRRVTVDAA